MNKEQRSQELYDILVDQAQSEGLELIDVEVKGQANNPIVIVYLDTAEDVEGGITIDALAAANKWLGNTLDEAITTRYTLEVSSPGGRSKRAKTE